MSDKTFLLYVILGLLLAGCSRSSYFASSTELPPATESEGAPFSPSMTSLQPSEAAPSDTPAPTEEPATTDIPIEPLTITVVYDNIPHDPHLTTDLGFSAYIQYHDHSILFDTGGNGGILLANMQGLDIDPANVDRVVLSHIHDDHTGGLEDFLAVSSLPPVYLLSAFPDSFIENVREMTEVIETEPGEEIAPDVYTTGEMPAEPPEQSLAILTPKGLVIITGCAHPGIVQIVRRAIEVTGEPVYMVMGGFHLGEASEDEIEAIISDLRDLGVQKVSPSHCTGELATHLFAETFGEDFISSGVGNVIVIDD